MKRLGKKNTMENKANALQEMDKLPISKAVNKNVLPAIVSMLMALIYNMADKVFIGMTGNDLMVAAITMATPVFVLFLSFGNIFGTGGISLISRLTGEGNLEKSKKVSSFCCWGSIGIGIVVMAILLIFMTPIIQILGASDAQTISFTRDYLTYIAICCPFSILSTTLSSLMRAEGKPTLSMIGMILGNVLNIILDPVFILGFHTGTKGAAIATLIGQVASAAFYFVCIYTGRSHLNIRLRDFTMGDGIASRVFAIGTPAALLTIFQSISNILMNNRMSGYGDIAVAGIGAAQNIITIIGIFAVGIGTGVQPLLGYQIGNGNKDKFKGILRYSFILTLGISLVLTVLCYLFAGQIINAFVSSPEAMNYGISFARIILTTCWIYCLFSVCAMVMQAMGKATAATIVNLSRNAYVYIPVMYLMSAIFSMNGIVWAIPVSDVISMIIAAFVLKRTIRSCFQEGPIKNA
jgi:multidrug efflux pump